LTIQYTTSVTVGADRKWTKLNKGLNCELSWIGLSFLGGVKILGIYS